ncbi:16S rRNA (guanine(527)-N(7))-methyltransferase RsmG [Mulberry dwarf phytoplasma]|uniref:16S rRNA (guanine(527)-N(7))-methyltransferase RsmG n=1 Tax=Mulberry dwarf phytoplasma TaxID=186171 RepID=UPI001D11D5C6|nr:16S rRNA (guanine(527)-N(7))-methyltransferase RsmG [Mulberry dwarf phytoplasma]
MLYFESLKDKFALNEKQLNKFVFYYEFLKQENQKMNLTSLISLSDVCYKHFYDSLILKEIFNFNTVTNLCDVGSGAGFPSFPLKILFPHLKIVIIESSLKKINFLKQLESHLELDNICFFHQRVEQYDIEKNGSYDCVVARALARLEIILKWCVPLVKKKGYFIAMKGKNFQQELEANKKIIKQIRVKLVSAKTLELPMQLGTRTNLLFQTE